MRSEPRTALQDMERKRESKQSVLTYRSSTTFTFGSNDDFTTPSAETHARVQKEGNINKDGGDKQPEPRRSQCRTCMSRGSKSEKLYLFGNGPYPTQMDDDDPVVSVLPIHYSNALSPNLHIHQFPLLSRPLQTPPSAALSGKRIRARIKPNVRRFEVHVPADTRPGFWNADRSKELGASRMDDDQDKNQETVKGKQRENEEPRLGEVRMRSEQIPQKGAYMLGIVRDGRFIILEINIVTC